ncbi:MAG TPA: CBASS oligonucleotide cyclase [Thermoanaerobaculia bacterium]
MSIKARFEKFSREIKPTQEHIDEANRQTDYMITQLKNRVAADGSFKLEKILKAGSNAKFTSLRRTEDNLFDVDLGAYYSGEGATKDRLNKLIRFTRDQLCSIYPQKDDGDFEELKSAARVKFRSGIKLNVDVAPIIIDDSLDIENGGWIPRADGWRLTSITSHNQFVHRRTGESKKVSGPVKFNRLVRMVKWWNNLQGDMAQPSIFCELITAKAFEECRVTSEWQTSLRQVFSCLCKHQFLEPIIFNDFYDAKKVLLPNDDVVVMDSVNPENNVSSSWTEETRVNYLDRIYNTYDHSMEARSAELDGDEEAAVDAWCGVFGKQFRTLSEPEEEGR